MIVPSLGKALSSLVLLAVLAAPLSAQTPLRTPSVLIESTDIASGDQFGWRIDADGPVLVAGAINDSSAGYAGGALYVFERDGAALAWNQVLEIHPATTGRKIAGGVVSGDTFAYVETAVDDEVHVWERGATGAWQEVAVFTDPDYDFNTVDNALALDGDDLLVLAGAGPQPRPYKVNHYQRSGGTWQLVDDSLDYDLLFRTIELAGDTLVYGRRIAERNPATGTFVPVTELALPAGANNHPQASFGSAVAVSSGGQRIAMGASWDTFDGSFSGSTYVYDRDSSGQWNLTARLEPSDPLAYRSFGKAVDFAGEDLVVLGGGNSSQGADPRGYLFQPDAAGALVETLRFDSGGERVAAIEDVAFIGNPFTGDAYAGVGGNVRVFAYVETTPPPQVTIDPIAQCPVSSLLSVTGSVSAADAIDRLAQSVDGGPEQVLCTGCGVDPSFSFDVNLLSCQDNTIEVTAEDTGGQVGRDSAVVYFDDQTPTFAGCQDQTILIAVGESVGSAVAPVPADNCEIVIFECINQTDFSWPTFPIGDGQPASCYAIDRCGREGRCDFQVSVQIDAPPGCEVFDFRDELGGGTLVLDTAVLGDGGSGGSNMTASGLEVFAFGSELGPASDNGTFEYREVAGAFRLETPLPDPEDFSDDPKGGLMVRWGLAADAARAMVVRRPAGNTLEFAVRRSAGALGEPLATTISASGVTDIALEWQGGAVRAEYSTDGGTTWSQPAGALGGQATVTTGGLPTLAGFVVSSQSDEVIVGLGGEGSGHAPTKAVDDASFIFPYLSVCELEDTPPPPPPTPASGCSEDDFEDGAVGGEWTLTGVGNANQVSVQEVAGALELTADGATAFTGADNAGLLYQSFEGDFRAEVTVDGSTMTTGGAFRKAGLMIRPTLDDRAPRILANLVPFWNNSATETHLQFVARELQDGPGNIAIATDVVGVPRTVRLAVERSGDVFTVQYSTDGGATWTTPGGGLGGSATVAMPAEVLVGLDVVSNNISVTSTARFDDFSVCAPCIAEDDFDDGVLDPEWTLVGVGNANQQSVSESGGELQLTADGATAFYGADNAGFLYREITGDFRAEVTIDGNPMTTGGQYRKAGLMVRESLDKWDVRLIAQLAPFWQNNDETHLQFVAREAYGEPGRLPVARDVIGVPRIVRLAVIRTGETLAVEYSIDGGATWIRPDTGLGGSITIAGLAPTLLVGLDMVSNNISVTSTAHFDDFSVCAP